jgi:hypothetical protein
MYIPLWLLWIVGFAVLCCLIGEFVRHAEKERNLRKRLKQLEEKGEPLRLSEHPKDDPQVCDPKASNTQLGH